MKNFIFDKDVNPQHFSHPIHEKLLKICAYIHECFGKEWVCMKNSMKYNKIFPVPYFLFFYFFLCEKKMLEQCNERNMKNIMYVCRILFKTADKMRMYNEKIYTSAWVWWVLKNLLSFSVDIFLNRIFDKNLHNLKLKTHILTEVFKRNVSSFIFSFSFYLHCRRQ